MASSPANYSIITRLGSGGMAEVFKASFEREGSFSKAVALKRMLPHMSMDPENVRKFVQEAELTAKLDHSNIVRIYDFGTLPSDGLPFIAMELVDGLDLRRLLKEAHGTGRRIQVLEAVLIAYEVVKALAYAHGERTGLPPITHRDISPANILVSRAGEVKLSDFGIAKVYGVDTTQNVIKGKLSYMSPEQVRGELVDGRSDLYSLGVVLWEALTLRHLWKVPNEMALIERRKDPNPPDPPSKHNPEVPPALDKVVLRCLEFDRENRFDSASELASALEGLLSELSSVQRSRDAVLASLVNELSRRTSETATHEAPVSAPAAVTKDAQPPKALAQTPALAQAQEAGSPVASGARRWVLWAVPLALMVAAAIVLGLFLDFGGTEGRTSEPGARLKREAVEGNATSAPSPILDPGFGTLSLDSIPWAEVLWKGESLGTTPITDRKLPAGEVELVLRNEPAGLVNTVKVLIRKDEKTQEMVRLRGPG
ncbi:MAG TPA: protein kinase [Myxococcota bacterium]|nr:protein kinase [Myxococcota bacterium]HRY96900.1 protein kinase [Myxococcota bacterium]